MGILDKAREVTAAATTRAAELRDQATDAASSASERAAESLREQASDLAAGLRERAAAISASVTDATIGRVKTAIVDFNAALPIIALAGYTVSEVAVELGYSTEDCRQFCERETVPDEQVEEMLRQHEDALLATMLVRTLMAARKLQDATKGRKSSTEGASHHHRNFAIGGREVIG